MREVFSLVGVLDELISNVGELASPEPVDTSESSDFEVLCNRDFEVKKLGDVKVDQPVMGLDSHSRVLRFLGVDVHVVTGALVGGANYLIPGPGVSGVKWIGLKLRFNPTDEGILNSINNNFYVRSGYLSEYFTGSFNDEAVRDEVRNYVEMKLIELAKAANDYVLLIDGPIFPTPRVLSMTDNKYAELYRGIIKDRVGAISGAKAVGVVKRLGQSHYLARYFKACGADVPMVDDVTLAIKRVSSTFSTFETAYLGPIVLDVEGYRKYMWYLVRRLGNNVRVVRIEGLNEDIATLGRDYVGKLMTVSGTALPIHIADKIARRLNASVVNLIYSLRPNGLTYEGIEEVTRALGDLS